MMEEQMVKVAERVKHYRTQQGLTEAEFARKANIPLQRYMKIEQGSVLVQVTTLERLAKAAGVAYSAMLNTWPTVAELFGSSSSLGQDILEVFERIESHAMEEGTYWILYLLESYRELGDSVFRMAEAARREHLAA